MDAAYKTDLRELNDLNFARFDATVGERFARFDAEMAKRFAEADAKLERLAAQLNARIDNCVDRATFERRLGELTVTMEQRFGKLESLLTRRIYAVSTGALLTQLIALTVLFKFFAAR